MLFSEIQQKINDLGPLDFGSIFNRSIELFKKCWSQGFILTLFQMLLVVPFLLVFYIPFITHIISNAQSGEVDPEFMSNYFQDIEIFHIILFSIAILLISVFSYALGAAFFRILRKIDTNNPTTTSDFFYFFKSKYLSKFFLLTLATTVIAIVAVLLCYLPFFYGEFYNLNLCNSNIYLYI